MALFDILQLMMWSSHRPRGCRCRLIVQGAITLMTVSQARSADVSAGKDGAVMNLSSGYK